MTISRLLGLTFSAGLLAGTTASAQPAVAPHPHPVLDELVKEYTRLGLPLPPPNAELVGIERRKFMLPRGAEQVGIHPRLERYHSALYGLYGDDTGRYRIAYRLPPANPGARIRYVTAGWYGVGLRELANVEPEAVVAVRPPGAFGHFLSEGDGCRELALAVQCQALGWDDLAAGLYARARRKLAEEKSGLNPLAGLGDVAWRLRSLPLAERHTDRKAVLGGLAALYSDEPALRTRYNEWLLGTLKLTAYQRKAEPGTADALIDELTEYGDNRDWFAPLSGARQVNEASYWKLAELGFDAVPALAAHLNDDRLTRTWDPGFNNFGARWLLVGDLCSELLAKLSADELGSSLVRQGFRTRPKEALEWFEGARQVGEEAWFLARAMPLADGTPIVDGKGCVQSAVVRVIGAKYPDRLPAVYRAWLARPVEECGFTGADEVVASKLPQAQKVALLGEAVTGDARGRVLAALGGLARLDRAALRKHLLMELERIRLRAWLGWPESIGEAQLLRLTEAAADPACWDALASAGKSINVSSRLRLVWQVGAAGTGHADSSRPARLRFMIQFLEDEDRELCAAWDGVQVRDHAAAWIAVQLGLRTERPKSCLHPGETRGGLERLFFRAAVWRAAARELARFQK